MILVGIGVGAAFLGGYFLRFFTGENKNTEQVKESQINNVIVKDTVQVENHTYLIIGIFLIVAILFLFVAAFCFKIITNKLKKKYSRRARIQTPVHDRV